jgi:hypothetical protein
MRVERSKCGVCEICRNPYEPLCRPQARWLCMVWGRHMWPRNASRAPLKPTGEPLPVAVAHALSPAMLIATRAPSAAAVMGSPPPSPEIPRYPKKMARHYKYPQLHNLATQAKAAVLPSDWAAQAKAILCVPANFGDSVFLDELVASGLLTALHTVSSSLPRWGKGGAVAL